MTDLTWRCDVCKEERPDAAISVYKIQKKFIHKPGFQVNIKYCNDRNCIDGVLDTPLAKIGD